MVESQVHDNARIKVKFNGDLLKLNKVTYNHGPIVNIYIAYRIIPTTKDSSVSLQNCLFGVVKLTKNADIDKYKYFGHGIGFDSTGSFSYPLCLGNILKDFDLDYMEKTELTVCIYDFSVSNWVIANDKILDIHNYLMKKNNII